jgi:tRNA isopentenyl-2-thiomethyl-A-37 hydroxylase MiaE
VIPATGHATWVVRCADYELTRPTLAKAWVTLAEIEASGRCLLDHQVCERRIVAKGMAQYLVVDVSR